MNVSFYTKNIIMFICASILIILFGCGISCVNAEQLQEEITLNDEFNQNNLYIEEYITDIKDTIAKIDEVIKEMKSQKEYEKYPAVRLNLQTPFLGISAIVENKLMVKENISIFDATKKYSIRTIVNTRKFKIPSFSIGDIVLLTEEIDLDDKELTLENQNLVLNNLRIYLKRTQETLKFVNNQKNNLFKEYISKEILKKVQDLSDSITNIQNSIVKGDNSLLFIYLQDDNKEIFEELNKKYIELYDKCEENKEKLNNILITNEELEKIESDIKTLSSDCEKYLEKLEYIYDNYKLNVSYYTHLLSINKEIENEIEFINKISLMSKVDKEINIYDEQVDENISYETVTIFDLKREDLISKINEFYEKMNTKIKNIENENVLNEEQVNLTKVYTDEETLKMVLDIQNEYVEIFNNCVKPFYMSNYQNILKDCSNKIEKISKYTEVSVAKYMKDVYFDIPNEMDGLEKYSSSFVIYSNKLLDKIKVNISSLLQYESVLKNIYDEKINNSDVLS